MSKYDYIIVGSGFFGAVFAHEAHKKGKKVLVLEKRPHIGGNCYTENIQGINVHKYGAHIYPFIGMVLIPPEVVYGGMTWLKIPIGPMRN